MIKARRKKKFKGKKACWVVVSYQDPVGKTMYALTNFQPAVQKKLRNK